jgi:WXG100 family type VII secretion target
MPVTIPQVEAARPDTLIQAAADLSQKASGVSAQIDRQRATIEGLQAGWRGAASDAAVAKATPTLQRMQQIREALTRAQDVLQQGGAQLSKSRTSVLQTAGQLSGQGWQVGPDGTVSVRPGSPLDQYARISPVNAIKLQQLAAANSVTLKTLLAGFDTTDRQVGQILRGAVMGLDSPPANVGPAPAIPEGKDPEDVKKWWDSLSQQQRDQLLHDDPDKLGNLNGIPVADRSTANKAALQQDLDRVTHAADQHHVPVDQVTAHPQDYGLTPNDITRYTNATKVQQGLADNSRKTHGTPTFLQVYEPDKFNGQGRAAIAIGNPDLADNTAVVVPGTSHSVTEGWLSSDDAANVFNETSAADRSKTNSVVAWMGYDTPDAMTDPRVAQPDLAHQGGQLLASDVNALAATNKGDSHVTVIGHSYGSTTVADAAAGYGMHTDDVVLIGSPGTDMAKSAADFHLPENGHVYVGSASSDPVTHFGGIQSRIPGTDVTVGLGADPASDGFGSTRFKAEVSGVTLPWKDHSGYLVPGSESLFSISDIASGHGDALEHDGMTATHRGVWGMPAAFDPEILREPTSGHYHL